MTPAAIAEKLVQLGIDWVAITDHNSARNVRVFHKVLAAKGITVLPGIEIHTEEDVHILGYFATIERVEEFGFFIEAKLPAIPVEPERDGYSLQVDEQDAFTEMVSLPFQFPTNLNLEEALKSIEEYGGIAVFAHIFRSMGLLYQLGIIPEKSKGLPLEVFPLEKLESLLKSGQCRDNQVFLRSSDSHTLDSISQAKMQIICENRSFEEFTKAILGVHGRQIKICR